MLISSIFYFFPQLSIYENCANPSPSTNSFSANYHLSLTPALYQRDEEEFRIAELGGTFESGVAQLQSFGHFQGHTQGMLLDYTLVSIHHTQNLWRYNT